jgi:hypothetical protein
MLGLVEFVKLKFADVERDLTPVEEKRLWELYEQLMTSFDELCNFESFIGVKVNNLNMSIHRPDEDCLFYSSDKHRLVCTMFRDHVDSTHQFMIRMNEGREFVFFNLTDVRNF